VRGIRFLTSESFSYINFIIICVVVFIKTHTSTWKQSKHLGLAQLIAFITGMQVEVIIMANVIATMQPRP
jgi:hypothetical protein